MTDHDDVRALRTCVRCRYPVRPGWFHEERPQPEGSNVTVCSLRRALVAVGRGPLVDVLNRYLAERAAPAGPQP